MDNSTGFPKALMVLRLFAVGACMGLVLIAVAVVMIVVSPAAAPVGGGLIGIGICLISGWVGARRGYRRRTSVAYPDSVDSTMRPRRRRASWAGSVIALVVAAFLIAGGMIGIINGLASTAIATGTITSVGKDCHGTYRDARGAIHEFTHYGDKSYCGDEFHVGQFVTVHYDPSSPGVADTGSPGYTVAVHVLLLMVGLALTIPFLLLTANKWPGWQPLRKRQP